MLFGIIASGRALGPLVQRHLNHLGQVQGAARAALLDLLHAAKPVGDDERFRIGLANRREQGALADFLGHVVMFGLEAE